MVGFVSNLYLCIHKDLNKRGKSHYKTLVTEQPLLLLSVLKFMCHYDSSKG